MNIGIDIDDTTLYTINSMIKYADIYDIQTLGRNGTNGNLGLIQNRYYLKILYGWDDKTKSDFFNTYYKNILEECTEIPNASKTIRKLKEEGNKIHFVTARITSIPNCDTEEITKRTLQNNNIPYDNLIINASDKLTVCQENGIQIFIEDSFDTCKELEEHGIKTYLMTTRMNKNIDAGNIERINSWDELYLKFHEFIDENNIKIRQETKKDYKEIYNLVKAAFETAEHSDGNEQNLVNDLRKGQGYIPKLSLVAERNKKIVGYIMFTKILINNIEEITLAPLAILPECQKQGIGTELIKKGHEIAKRMGYHYSIVLGSEFYYPRVGYVSAKNFEIEPPFEVDSKNFMAIKLNDTDMEIKGVVRYSKEFGI